MAVPETASGAVPAGVPVRSNRRRVVRRILHNPLALTGLAVLTIAVILAVSAHWLAPHPPPQTDLSDAGSPPGAGCYGLGRDVVRRGVLSRIMVGVRVAHEVEGVAGS